MSRRLLAVSAAAALVSFMALAPGAHAAESIPSGPWAGSALSPGPSEVTVSSYNLAGTFRRSNVDRQVSVTVSVSPAGTGVCKVNPVTLAAATTPRAFNVALPLPCNGTYTLMATAVTTDNNAFFPQESVGLDRRITVAAPAPTVTNVTAEGVDRSVTVSWDDMRGQAPDLSGYMVERKIGSGSYKIVATPSASAQSFTDRDLPEAGGTATYRVSSMRPGPDGTLTSAASSGASADFAATPTTTTTGGATGADGGSGGVGGGDGGSGGGSAAPGSGGSGGTGGGRTPSSPNRGVSAPRVFAGTFLPPLLRPADETIRTSTTVADDGYEEALPFGDREVGAEDPVLPNDAMASILSDGESGRGLVIPVGTALVLAMWAVHLRVLARAARPID